MHECLFVFIIHHLELAELYDARCSALVFCSSLISWKGDSLSILLHELVGLLVDEPIDGTISALRDAFLGHEAVGS